MLERNDIFSGNFWRTPVEVPRYLLRHNSAVTAKGRRAWSLPVNQTRNIARAKSFADDLNKERGIVRGRVAVLLRSSEIKPLFSDFIFFPQSYIPGVKNTFVLFHHHLVHLLRAHTLVTCRGRRTNCGGLLTNWARICSKSLLEPSLPSS